MALLALVYLLQVAQATCPASLSSVAISSGTDCSVIPANQDEFSATCSNNQYSLAGQKTCETCPAGYHCSSTLPTRCDEASNQYAAAGASSCSTLTGTNTVTDLTQQTPCSPGVAYSSFPYVCQNCPKGFDCNAAPFSSSNECATGSYQSGGGGCATCPIGSYCPSRSIAVGESCPAGTYQPSGSQTKCVLCDKDHTCSAGSKTPCAGNQYSPLGVSNCQNCPAGHDCQGQVPIPCAPGTYNDGTSKTCTTCDPQYYCDSTTLANGNKQICPSGFYSDGGQVVCYECPPGYACQNGIKTQCNSDGQYSLAGKATCTNYVEGTQKNSPVQTAAPQTCPPGYYTETVSSQTCTICPVNSYCDGAKKYPCTSGTLCPLGSSSEGTCPDSRDCTTGASNLCTYGQKLDASGNCVSCSNTEVCLLRGKTTTPVSAGYYSPSDINVEFICPGGHDCTNPDGIVKCQTGWYAAEGAGTAGCTKCVVPYACPHPELTIDIANGIMQQIDCTYLRGFYQDADEQTACKPCPAGFYCPYGSHVKTPCNAGEYSLGASEFCHTCPPGYECPSTEKPLMNYCLTGTYSLGKQNVCTVCEEGYECVGSLRKPCAADKWSSRGDGICKFFDAGLSGYAPTPHDGAGVAQFTECPQGHFSLYGTITCTICPVGHYCPDNRKSFMPRVCLPGQYQDQTGQISCKSCGAGTYSLHGAIECHPCPAGHRCGATNQVPRLCEQGLYALAGDTSCSRQCTDGYLCKPGSTTATPANSLCPYGLFCKNNGNNNAAQSYQHCNSGQYQPQRGQSNNSACQNCQAGYYCPFGSSEQFVCPPGHYCGSKSNLPTQCPEGTYNPTYYAQDSSGTYCKACPGGYYCPAGSTQPIKCPAGYICSGNTTPAQQLATYCLAGTYSGAESISSSADCKTCPAGHYCPSIDNGASSPSIFPTPCPQGTYRSGTGGKLLSECSNCSAGRVCPYLGSIYGDQTSLPCLPGHQCPAGTQTFYQYSCNAGEYSDDINYGSCQPCPKGFACSAGTNTLTNPMVRCSPGYFCPQNSQIPNEPTNACPAGTYSDRDDLWQASDCYDCPPGKYCMGGNTAPDGDCYPGSYCPGKSTKVTTTGNCACTIAASDPLCTCPTGLTCVDGDVGVTTCNNIEKTGEQCPNGTYLNRSGGKSAYDCKICPLGYYCPPLMACEVGTTCAASGQSDICPLGKTCYYGTQHYESCPAGTYGKFDKLWSASSSCGTNCGCETCPAGYICATTAMTVPTPCGKGFYSAAGEMTACSTCDAGKYCERIDTSDTMMAANSCLAGYQCVAGTSERPFADHEDQWGISDKYSCPPGNWCTNGSPTACLAGKYNPLYGGDAITDCLDVPAGYYTETDGQSDFITNQCPMGHFCPIGTSNKNLNICPKGTFRRTLQATQESDCADCPSGYYCPEQSMEPMSCPRGYYCGEKFEFPLPCPIGTFGAGERLTNVKECTTCYGGRFCSQYGLIEPDGECDPGFYCVDKSMTPVPKTLFVVEIGNVCEAGGYCPQATKYPLPCRPGYYQPSTGKKEYSDCVICQCGNYCDGRPDTTRTDIPDALSSLKAVLPGPNMSGLCDAGYWCQEGSSHPKQFSAQPGHYTLAGACGQSQCLEGTYQFQQAQSSCVPCKERYYCPNKAMDYPTPCGQGKYCPGTSQISQTNCGTGRFSDLFRLKSNDECQLCISGAYCTSLGLTDIQGQCSSGYFCWLGSTSATPATLSANHGPCPNFMFCDASGGTGVGLGAVCYPGTYRNAQLGTVKTDCTPTIQGYYSNTVDLTDPINPTMTRAQCSEGYYCKASVGTNWGNSWPTNTTTYCNVGEFCIPGSHINTVCPAGTFQFNKVQGDCIQCPPGYFCDNPSLITVVNFVNDYKCPAGHWCEAGTTSSTQNPCPPGTYNPNKGAKTSSECIPAPPGFFIAAAGQSALNTADKCNAGYYCMLGSYTATPSAGATATFGGYNLLYQTVGGQCTDGYYCPAGSPKMLECTAGYICDNALNGGQPVQTPTLQCTQGYYCPTGTHDNNKIKCPPGYFCITGSQEPIPCPAGTFSNAEMLTAESQCQDCTVNYFCPDIHATQVNLANICDPGFTCPAKSVHSRTKICSLGHKCPQSSLVEEACDPTQGKYQDQLGASDCLDCPSGYFCDQVSKTRCEPQNTGISYYCTTTGANRNVTCPAGTYTYQDRASSPSDCLSCPKGYYCPLNPTSSLEKIVSCKQGYYCMGGVSDQPGNNYEDYPCPAGFYCPLGTNVPLPCPVGTYCATPGLFKFTGYCKEGYYCELIKTTAAELGGLQFCMNNEEAGCYKGHVVEDAVQCPAGSFCNIGSYRPQKCPIGTWLDTPGATSSADCKNCTAGSYCVSHGQTSNSKYCEPGYYCEQRNSDVFQNPCPAGHKCVPGVNFNGLTQCEKGSYQPNEIQSMCYDCPVGYYCDELAMTTPKICPVGYYCGLRTITPVECGKGKFSDLTGIESAAGCQKGSYGKYYNNLVSISPTSGIDCPELFSCYHTDLTTGPGFQESTDAVACVDGEICPSGTAVPEQCKPGTYMDYLGAQKDNSLCKACPEKYYCPDWGITAVGGSNPYTNYPCPAGYVCIGAAIHPSKRDNVSIKLCSVGYFCDLTKGTQQSQQQCPINFFSNVEGQAECTKCPAGFRCLSLGTVNPEPCPRGYYCTEPVADFNTAITSGHVVEDISKPCPAGTYNSQLYGYRVEDCLSCPPGKYCAGGQQSYTGLCDKGYVCTGGQSVPNPTGVFDTVDYADSKSGPCPKGHYCPTGSSYPIPCQVGTYQDQTGQSECKSCDAYKYCGRIGLTSPEGYCSSGFVCFGGASVAKPNDYTTGRPCKKGQYCTGGRNYLCANGTYAPVQGMMECTKCPPGYYCSDPDGPSQAKECPTHNYCPAGTADPILCPNGTYTEVFQTGLESVDQCADCPTGYYCQNGEYSRSNACSAGYFCLSGAAIPNLDSNICPSGFFCLEGTKLPTACQEGKYTLPGAKTADDCKDCEAGYYCVTGVTTSYINECPEGHYCPPGEDQPRLCPKGTYNSRTKMTELEDCRNCTAGYLCDRQGIMNQEDHLCPPGFYCPQGSYTKKPCPPGTFRPQPGAGAAGPVSYSDRFKTEQSCFACPAGFYCPNEATTIPELCEPGSYCPPQSQFPITCDPGYYCIAGSGEQTPCAPGFYCTGGTEEMVKCKFGTFCQAKASFETPCPAGTYGSGNVNNFDEASACNECGRGLYSTQDKPNECLDCTPGFVCKGRTSSPEPRSEAVDGGYKCPLGHYCPLGSYREEPCPVGTYGKYMGLIEESQCIKCKTDNYQDEPGQEGCKKCSSTARSDGGSTTCYCVGKGRNFVKSIGACLCSKGFKPKNDAKNIDSPEDCEADVKEVCAAGEEITMDGNCITNEEDERIYCDSQCVGGGRIVSGTGTCECFSINDTGEVCGAACQKTKPKTTITKDGMLKVRDPTTGKEGEVDPSTLGYHGEFKSQSKAGKNETKVVFLDVGEDFSFSFDTNSDVLDATQVEENTNHNENIQKLALWGFASEDPWENRQNPGRSRRRLQGQRTTKLFNPVLCIQEGDAVFFNINSELKQYPVYSKDSILNTNDDFDFGPFETLADMINRQNITVSTYSYIFRDEGIFVFENSQTGTLTIISVVNSGQSCSNAQDGIGAAMVTKESLAEIGVKAYEKNVNPNWWFIMFTFVLINSLIYAFIGLFIWAYNKSHNQGRTSSKDAKSNTLYYDKLREHDEEMAARSCFACCRGKKMKKENKVDAEDELQKSHDFAVSYKDMESLLEDFHTCQAVLKQQLKDREKQKKKKDDDDEDADQASLEPIEQLIGELNEMARFINENNEVVNKVLEEEANDLAVQDKSKPETSSKTEKDFFEPDALAHKSQLKKQVTIMIEKQLKKEEDDQKQIMEQFEKLQEENFHRELDKNDQMKDKIMSSFKARLQHGNLSTEEQAAMMADLNAKMAQINDALEGEQDAQNRALAEALARRRGKKRQLQDVIEKVADKKDKEDEHYQKKLKEIQKIIDNEGGKIENELKDERAAGLEQIDEEAAKMREERLKNAEKKLKDFTKRGLDEDREIVFQEMTANYGKLVEQVDADMKAWKKQQEANLEERLKQRRANRKQEAEDKKKELEAQLNKETQNQRGRLNNEMNQVQSLVKPIKDEEERLKMVAGDLQNSDAIKHSPEDVEDLDVSVTSDKDMQALAAQQEKDDQTIKAIIRDLDKENTKKKLEIAQAREQMNIKIQRCNDDDGEKQRLLNSLNQFEDSLKDQMRSETEGQNSKLLQALEQRRKRRKVLNDKIAKKKQDKILADFREGAGSKVNMQLNLQRTQGIANRIQAGFEKDEQVQVSENFLDKKSKQELLDLMQSLFDERAKSLRKFIYELMKEKQRDLQALKEEFEPLREMLRQRKANGLINEDFYKEQMEQLNKDEHDRRMEIEIEYADREAACNEELEKARLDAEAEQKKVLKDRQTQEKLIMFNEMMKNMDNQDQMKQYLEMQKRDTEKELEQYRRRADFEKEKKLNEMELEKEKKMQELADRQERMFNWEDKIKIDENKIMEGFRRQKEEMMAKKLAEQQKEILRDMNKEDVDALLAKHKRQLLQMDEALRREQERQMALMNANRKEKNSELAREKLVKQIKLAEIQKKKAEDAARAMEMQQNEGEPMEQLEVKNERLEQCKEKVNIMQQLIYKAAYSRPITYKRILYNQHKLNLFLGRDLLAEKDDEINSDNFSLSNESHIDKKVAQSKKLTYSELLQRIANAEQNYNKVKLNQVGAGKVEVSSNIASSRPGGLMSHQSTAFGL